MCNLNRRPQFMELRTRVRSQNSTAAAKSSKSYTNGCHLRDEKDSRAPMSKVMLLLIRQGSAPRRQRPFGSTTSTTSSFRASIFMLSALHHRARSYAYAIERLLTGHL